MLDLRTHLTNMFVGFVVDVKETEGFVYSIIRLVIFDTG